MNIHDFIWNTSKLLLRENCKWFRVGVYQLIELTHLFAGNQSVGGDFQGVSEVYRITLI